MRKRELTLGQICDSFPAADHPIIQDLIAELQERGFVISANEADSEVGDAEDPSDIFYWHFGQNTSAVNARLSAQKIAIIEANDISRQLAASFRRAGVNVDIIGFPKLRTPRDIDNGAQRSREDWPGGSEPVPYDSWDSAGIGCLVATSELGGASQMREWNAFCLEKQCHFLPVVLQDLIGYVGPLIVPGETACFEWMMARWRSNLDGDESRWEVLGLGGTDFISFHTAMPTIVGAIAALELTKFYGIGFPAAAAGRLIEFNFLTMRMDVCRVLKVPRCPVCSSLNSSSPMSLTKNLFGLIQEEGDEPKP